MIYKIRLVLLSNIFYLIEDLFKILDQESWIIKFLFWELNIYKEIGYEIDFKDYVKDRLSESNNNYISEAGHKETWKGKIDEERVDQHLSEVIEYLESLKK